MAVRTQDIEYATSEDDKPEEQRRQGHFMGFDAEACGDEPGDKEARKPDIMADVCLATSSSADSSPNYSRGKERARPPLNSTTSQRCGIALLALFTVFITWRTKSLEQIINERRPVLELLSKKAPDFSLPALDSGPISLADYRGKKTLVLSYWASWCLPCRAELPELRDFYKKYHHQNSDFEVLAISLDEEPSEAVEYATAEKLPFPVLLDPRGISATAYSVDGIPTVFVIDKNGTVTYAREGLDQALQFQLMRNLGIELPDFPGSEKQGQDKEGDNSNH